MAELTFVPPHSPVEAVTEIIHGVPVTDPYRWLEDQWSSRTREWVTAQQEYARTYLNQISGRERVQERIRELLDVEVYDSILQVGRRHIFRKRLRGQEQPCIFLRESPEQSDQLLIDPAERATGPYTSVRPLRLSHDGRLLLYQVKEGGERTGTFEIFAIDSGKRLPDVVPRGYLQGFAFAPDGKSFFYVHEPLQTNRRRLCAAYVHILGTPFDEDQEVFRGGADKKTRLTLLADKRRLIFVVSRFAEKTSTDIYLNSFERDSAPSPIFLNLDYRLSLQLASEKIFAMTDRNAPNRHILEIRLCDERNYECRELIPESDSWISDWLVLGNHIFLHYQKYMAHQICVFDLSGRRIGEVPIREDETVRMIGGSPSGDELMLQSESFVKPITTFRYCIKTSKSRIWAKRNVPFRSRDFRHSQVWYASTDGTKIPMSLVGRHDVLEQTHNPMIMTSYGGFGRSMTPQFSVFVAYLMERGCLFALPNIRGGSEFGSSWHDAAKRRRRQTAYDDFLCAAEWSVRSGLTEPNKLAIFGGSNSGLLVGAAMTQRPDLFQAVVCMAPILDMLRYHMFDTAYTWKEEFGTADDFEDFLALSQYSPYHCVREGVSYPAVMLVSGDADGNCNALHARKMTARLQAANASLNPIFLDYSRFRGHSAVLPLSERTEALTDRLAFLCDQLKLSM